MCFSKCLENNVCPKTIGKNIPKKLTSDGKRLLYKSKDGAGKQLSHYLGDCEYTIHKDGSITVIEQHNIERVILVALASIMMVGRECSGLQKGIEGYMHLSEIIFEVQYVLDNDHIYDALVNQRLLSLKRRDFIEIEKGGWCRMTRAGYKKANEKDAWFKGDKDNDRHLGYTG